MFAPFFQHFLISWWYQEIFPLFYLTSQKLRRQIKGYCYTKPYLRTGVYNFWTKSTQINNLEKCQKLKMWKSTHKGPFPALRIKWWSVSSLTVIEYSSDKQMLWSVCTYAQSDLSLSWSHIPQSSKSHVTAHIYVSWSTSELRVR